MQTLVLTRGRLRKAAINAVMAAVCGAGLMVCATLNEAEAAKGGNARAATTGTATPTPSPVVRDHRGQSQTLPAPTTGACKRGHCHPTNTDKTRVRDHRTR
jgi:hypothetical protein